MSTQIAPPPSAIVTSINQINGDILQYLPLATQTVAAVEAATKGAVPGTTKLTMSLNIIQALASGTAQASGSNQNVQAIAGLASLVTAIVQSFNQSGLFSHSSTPVPAPSDAVTAQSHPSVLMKIFHPHVAHQQEALAAQQAQATPAAPQPVASTPTPIDTHGTPAAS